MKVGKQVIQLEPSNCLSVIREAIVVSIPDSSAVRANQRIQQYAELFSTSNDEHGIWDREKTTLCVSGRQWVSTNAHWIVQYTSNLWTIVIVDSGQSRWCCGLRRWHRHTFRGDWRTCIQISSHLGRNQNGGIHAKMCTIPLTEEG